MTSKRNWNLDRGYRIYFNLHKKCYSIQAWDADKSGWRLYQHLDRVYIKNATTQINERNRKKVILERRKNVHAFILTNWISDDIEDLNLKRVARYNPYIKDHFFDSKTGEPIHKLKEAVLKDGIVMY